MKKGKMVGAIALTAALAMGTMPAFAASASNDADKNEFSDSGSTTINAKIDAANPQVRAKVPLTVVVVFGASGVSSIQGPGSDVYAITNSGEGDIKVSNAELTDMNSSFTSEPVYDNSDGTADNASGQITSGCSIMFTYTTASNKTYLTTKHALSDAVAADDRGYLRGAKNFSAETITVGNSMGIELAGTVCNAGPALESGDMTDTLCKIKYTIEAA